MMSVIAISKQALVQQLAAERLRQLDDLGLSLRDIGGRYDVSYERVRQLKKQLSEKPIHLY